MEENPYLALLGKNQPQVGGVQPTSPMGGTKPNMNIPSENEDPTQFSVTADDSRELISAVSSLHKYIANVTSPDKIQRIRDIMIELTKLIQEDQSSANTQAPQQSALSEAQPA